MRIAQVSTLSAPVRQDASGSIEYLVWLLTRELVGLGHEVTVFGSAGSKVDGQCVATLPGPYGTAGSLDDWQLCEWVNLCRALEQSHHFDVIHSHAYLWGVPLQPFSKCPMVHTTHIVPDDNSAGLWKMSPGSCVTAISRHQWSQFPDLKPAAIIPHGVHLSEFSFQAEPGDYVCYLGRFTSGKGPYQAIKTAQALGLKLLLAGPENAYFNEEIRPLIDSKTVEYVGYVSGAERSKLLGGARALLYPIQYPEAFGLVLVEAMLCGTPIAALNLGAVPEIVEENLTGCLAESMTAFPQAVKKCLTLDRGKIRAQAEQRFSAGKMARDYVSAYEMAIRSCSR